MNWKAAVCLAKTIYVGNCQTYSIEGFKISYYSLPISIFIKLFYISVVKSMPAIRLSLYLAAKDTYLIFHVITGIDWKGGVTTNIPIREHFDLPTVSLPISNHRSVSMRTLQSEVMNSKGNKSYVCVGIICSIIICLKI